MIELAFWAAHAGWNRGSRSKVGSSEILTNTIMYKEPLQVADSSRHASLSVNAVLTFPVTDRSTARELRFQETCKLTLNAAFLVKQKLHPLLGQLNIARCRLHAFRRANATLMDRLNVPMKIRQQRLGHSDPRITLGTYTYLASSDD
jgi:hypothetical protein